jgi:hypothetical protein
VLNLGANENLDKIIEDSIEEELEDEYDIQEILEPEATSDIEWVSGTQLLKLIK